MKRPPDTRYFYADKKGVIYDLLKSAELAPDKIRLVFSFRYWRFVWKATIYGQDDKSKSAQKAKGANTKKP